MIGKEQSHWPFLHLVLHGVGPASKAEQRGCLADPSLRGYFRQRTTFHKSLIPEDNDNYA